MSYIIDLDDSGKPNKGLSPEMIDKIESIVCISCKTSPEYIGGQKFKYCCSSQFVQIDSVYNENKKEDPFIMKKHT